MSDFPGFPSPFSTWNQYTTSRTSFPAGNPPLSGLSLGFTDPGYIPVRAAALPDPFTQLPSAPLRALPSIGQARLHPNLYLADVPGLEPLYACSLPGLPESRSLLHSPNLTLSQNPSPLTFDQIYRASSSVSPVSQYRNQFDQRYINSRILLPNRLSEPKLPASTSLDLFRDHKERKGEKRDRVEPHLDKSQHDIKVQKFSNPKKDEPVKSQNKNVKIWNPFESEPSQKRKDSQEKETVAIDLTESEIKSGSKERSYHSYENESSTTQISGSHRKTFPAVPIPHYPIKPIAVYDTGCRDFSSRKAGPSGLFSPVPSQFKSSSITSCDETQASGVPSFKLEKDSTSGKDLSSEQNLTEAQQCKNVEKDLNQNIEVERNCNLLNVTVSLKRLDSKQTAVLICDSKKDTFSEELDKKGKDSTVSEDNEVSIVDCNQEKSGGATELRPLLSDISSTSQLSENIAIYDELKPENNNYTVPYRTSSSHTDGLLHISCSNYNSDIVHCDIPSSFSYNTHRVIDHQKSSIDTNCQPEFVDSKVGCKPALTSPSQAKSKLCSPKSSKDFKAKATSSAVGSKTRTGTRKDSLSVQDELSVLSNQVNEIRSRRNSINKESSATKAKTLDIAHVESVDQTFVASVENPKASVVYKYKPTQCSKFGRSLKMASTESALSMLKNSEDSLSASISSSQISESDSDTQMSNDQAEKLFSESQSLNTQSMFSQSHARESHDNFLSPMNAGNCEDGQFFKTNTNPSQMCQMDNDNQKPYLCVQEQNQFSDKSEMLPPYSCYASNQSESGIPDRGNFQPHEENSNFTITSGRVGIDTMDASIDYDENSVGVSDSNQAVHDCESQLSQSGDSPSHKDGMLDSGGQCVDHPGSSVSYITESEQTVQWEFLHSKQYIDNIYGNQIGCEPVKTDTLSIRDSDSPKTFIDLDTTTKEKKARDSMRKELGREGFHAKHFGKAYQRPGFPSNQRVTGMYGNQSYDGYGNMSGRWNNFSRNGNDQIKMGGEMDSSQYENGQYRNNYQSGYSQMNHGQNGNDKGFSQSGYHHGTEYSQNPPNYYNQNQSMKNYQGNHGNNPRGFEGGNYYGNKGEYNNSPHNMYPPNAGEMAGGRFGNQGYNTGQSGFGGQHYTPQSPSHGASDNMGGQYANHSGHSYNLPRNSSPASTVSDFPTEPVVVAKKKRGRKRKVDKEPPDESKPKPNTVVTATMSIGPLIDVDNPDCPIETYDYNQQIETIFNFTIGDDLSPIGAQFLKIEQRVSHKLLPIKYGHPVTVVYNPLSYAFQTHRDFVSKFCTSERPILFLGMNPGPYGMSQNGVPFGEATVTRDWLKITGDIYKPEVEHPKKPVTGLACTRNEVSGARFWGLFQKICKCPENFFKNCFVYNFCPYAYMSESGKNITPPQLTHAELDQITETCDVGLVELVKLLNTHVIIAVGKFVQQRASKALHNAGIMNVKVECILHPSPINPHANKGWEQIVAKQLVEMNVMQYLNSDMEEVQGQIEEWEKIAASNAKLAE